MFYDNNIYNNKINNTNKSSLDSNFQFDSQGEYEDFFSSSSNNNGNNDDYYFGFNDNYSTETRYSDFKVDYLSEFSKVFPTFSPEVNLYDEDQIKKNEAGDQDLPRKYTVKGKKQRIRSISDRKSNELINIFHTSQLSINSSILDNNNFLNGKVNQEDESLLGTKRGRPRTKKRELKKASRCNNKSIFNSINEEVEEVNEDNSTIEIGSENGNKKLRKEKKFERLDEPFKGIKSTSFKILVWDIIKQLEKKRSKSNWNIISNKNFRLHFIVNVKKNDNREYLNMSIKEIITHIYEVKIQKAIEFLQGNITRNGKPLKNQKKRDENIKFYEESLDLFNMAEFNFDTLFSEKSRIILDKTYFDIINEFKESNAMKIYLQKITKSQTGQFVKNFNYILKKFKVYLGNKNENKIRRTFYNRDEIILENQEDIIIIEEEEFENEEYSTNGLSHSFSQ